MSDAPSAGAQAKFQNAELRHQPEQAPPKRIQKALLIGVASITPPPKRRANKHKNPKLQNAEPPSQPQRAPSKRKTLLTRVASARPPPKSRNVKRKKTLIRYNSLKGPHNDIHDMRALLIADGYAPEDITILVDDGNPSHTQPTRANILKACDDLVKDAKPCDHFFFLFAGHSGQRPSDDPWEEDGMDEYIVTSDSKSILDGILHERLVKPLPAKSSLTAVMDSCHSCTLLDLKHHRCNRIHVPWIENRSKTRQHSIVRKQARWSTIIYGSVRQTVSVRSQSWTPSNNIPPPSVRRVFASCPEPASPRSATRKRPTLMPINTNIANKNDSGWLKEPSVFCTSPTTWFCDGFRCRQPSSIDEHSSMADVICLSSSKDDQQTWEDKNGVSMTRALINHLRAEPHPLLQDLMSYISFAIFKTSLTLYAKADEYNKAVKKWVVDHPVKLGKRKRTPSLRVINLQNPQLSSHRPLDMKTDRWNL